MLTDGGVADVARRLPTLAATEASRAASWSLSTVAALRGLVAELPDGTRNRIQTPVLLDALEKHRFTAVFGGARRGQDLGDLRRVGHLGRYCRPHPPQEP